MSGFRRVETAGSLKYLANEHGAVPSLIGLDLSWRQPALLCLTPGTRDGYFLASCGGSFSALDFTQGQGEEPQNSLWLLCINKNKRAGNPFLDVLPRYLPEILMQAPHCRSRNYQGTGTCPATQ